MNSKDKIEFIVDWIKNYTKSISKQPVSLVIGVSGGDAVKVTLNGDGDMINLDLSDEVIKEEKGIIVDLIRDAHSNAKNQLKSKTSDEISKATGAFGIPGFKWPL